MNKHDINEYDKKVNLKEYVFTIKKRFIWILVITSITTILGVIHNTYLKSPPLYQTSKTIIVEADPDTMNTLLALAKDPLVLDKISEEIDLYKSPGSLSGQISYSTVNTSKVVKVTVTDSNPEMVVEIAEKTVKVFKSEMESFLGFSNIKEVPESSFGDHITEIPQGNNRTVHAFVLGLILSFGLIFLLDYLDNSVKNERDIEASLGVPLLGTVSSINSKNVENKTGYQFENDLRGERIGIKQDINYWESDNNKKVH